MSVLEEYLALKINELNINNQILKEKMYKEAIERKDKHIARLYVVIVLLLVPMAFMFVTLWQSKV